MDSMEIIELKVDTTTVDTAMDDIHKGFSLILSLLTQTSAALIKVINSLQRNLSVVEQSLHKISTTLEEVQLSFSAFAESYQAMNEDNQWVEDAIAGVETVFSIVGTIAGVAAALLTAGVEWPIVVAVAAIMAIVTAVEIAIVALVDLIIENWDKIKLFFTETLPQLWSQFVEWVSGIGAAAAGLFSGAMSAISGFFTDCWNGIVEIWSGIGEWMQSNVIQPILDFFTPIVQ